MDTSDTIQAFYSAFKNGDTATMASFYHDEAEFTDPAFGHLKGNEIKMMWKMLIERSRGNLDIEYTIVDVTSDTALVQWEARYTFSQTNRPIHNKITARLTLEDGLIKTHTDRFNLWKWSQQALGFKGILIGWTPFFRKKLQQKTRKLLHGYIKQNA